MQGQTIRVASPDRKRIYPAEMVSNTIGEEHTLRIVQANHEQAATHSWRLALVPSWRSSSRGLRRQNQKEWTSEQVRSEYLARVQEQALVASRCGTLGSLYSPNGGIYRHQRRLQGAASWGHRHARCLREHDAQSRRATSTPKGHTRQLRHYRDSRWRKHILGQPVVRGKLGNAAQGNRLNLCRLERDHDS